MTVSLRRIHLIAARFCIPVSNSEPVNNVTQLIYLRLEMNNAFLTQACGFHSIAFIAMSSILSKILPGKLLENETQDLQTCLRAGQRIVSKPDPDFV